MLLHFTSIPNYDVQKIVPLTREFVLRIRQSQLCDV
jgi:hypothetical protein